MAALGWLLNLGFAASPPSSGFTIDGSGSDVISTDYGATIVYNVGSGEFYKLSGRLHSQTINADYASAAYVNVGGTYLSL